MSGTELFASLLGSIALLLWGVRMVRTGMTRAFGAALRRVLATYTRTRLSAFLTGLGVTGVLQSSMATALLLASFASRGLIALPLALAVMLGADVGSAVAAQIFSFDVKWLWSLLVALGVFLFLASEADKARGAARIAIGLGLMLLASAFLSTHCAHSHLTRTHASLFSRSSSLTLCFHASLSRFPFCVDVAQHNLR